MSLGPDSPVCSCCGGVSCECWRELEDEHCPVCGGEEVVREGVQGAWYYRSCPNCAAYCDQCGLHMGEQEGLTCKPCLTFAPINAGEAV